MRARWWHYVAAWVLCLSGLAVIISRAHVLYRDPNLRSCRVFGLSDGFFMAHTYGSGSPAGLTIGYTARHHLGREPWGGALLFGDYAYKSINDPNAEYGSDWSVTVPLWLPWYICLPLLVPYVRRRAALNMERCRRRRVVDRRAARRAAIRAGDCPECGYDLRGLASSGAGRTCPECGDSLTSRPAC